MGAILSTFADKPDETAELLKSTFERMDENLNAYYDKITNVGLDTKLIPIDKVVNKNLFIKAVVSSETDGIDDIIDSIVTTVDKGPSGEGLGHLAKAVVKGLLGGSRGTMLRKDTYSIRCNAINGMVRLDMLWLSYNMEQASFRTKCQSVIGCIVVESSAEISALNDNTVRVVIGDCFSDSTAVIQNTIYLDFYWNVLRKKDELTRPLTEEEKKQRTADLQTVAKAKSEWAKKADAAQKAVQAKVAKKADKDKAAADANKQPGTDASKQPGTDASKQPGTDASKQPGTDAGKQPGTDAGKQPGTDTNK